MCASESQLIRRVGGGEEGRRQIEDLVEGRWTSKVSNDTAP